MKKPAVSPKSGPIVYYEDRDFLITSSKAKSLRKTYRIDKIEKVSLRRDPFYIMLAVTIFIGLFIVRFGAVNFPLQVYLLMLFCAVVTFISSYFGLLFVTSKAISELGFIGVYERLADVRLAIEKSMHKEDPDDGMASNDDEEQEDDDDE